MKKFKIGYTQGVFDMFHIGHLNLINSAKQFCDYLIVGVNSDELVKIYKNKTPIIEENSRKQIVENIKAVDQAVIVDTLDKLETQNKFGYDAIFVGNDWEKNPRWIKTKSDLAERNVEVIFLPYTPQISSSSLREKLKKD